MKRDKSSNETGSINSWILSAFLNAATTVDIYGFFLLSLYRKKVTLINRKKVTLINDLKVSK